MNISIIGYGNVGSALAQSWAKKGHNVVFGARDLKNPKLEKALSLHPSLKASSISESVSNSEVVLIATPSSATKELAEEIKGLLKKQIIIDSMNSVRFTPEGFQNTFDALKKLTGYQNIVKCFNCTGSENMGNPVYPEGAIDMFMAGDSKQSKEIVGQLAHDAGFSHCYDLGGDEKIPLLEAFALTWINLAYMQGLGRNFAFKIVKR
jgi:8-hydroxy-5-deazaflavin:NADPH oxidoreductase